MNYDHWKTTELESDRNIEAERLRYEEELAAEEDEQEAFLEQRDKHDREMESTLSAERTPGWALADDAPTAPYSREELEPLEDDMALDYIEYDLTERVAKARDLVHTALMAAEAGNGLGLLRIDSLLTEALSELGCKTCGKRIPLEHMQTMAVCRRRCECVTYCEGH